MFIKNALLAAVSVLASLIVGEIGLRFIVHEPPRQYACVDGHHPAYTDPRQCPISQDRISRMQFSPDLLYQPTPKSKGEGWSSDSRGLRRTSGNHDDVIMPDPGSLTIAVTGGSTAWGVGVRDEQTIASVLHDKLAAACPRTRVIVLNGAISAQTSGQERRRFESALLPLRPDIYVALTGFNDIYNAYTGLLPHQNRDYFDVAKRFGATSVNDFVPQPPDPKSYALKLRFLLDKAIYMMTATQQAVLAAVERRALDHQVTIDSMARNARLLQGWARDYGFEYVYALQPSIYHTRKVLTRDETAIRDQDKHFGDYSAAGYDAWRIWLRGDVGRRGFNYIDLDDAIAGTTADLFIDNVHFGDRGYALIASFLAHHVLTSSAAGAAKCKT